MLCIKDHGKNRIASLIMVVLHYLVAAVFILNQNCIWRFLENTPERLDDYILLVLLGLVVFCLILKMSVDPSLRRSSGFMKTAFIMIYLTVFMVLNYFFPYYYMEFAIAVFALGIYFFVCNDHDSPEVLTAYKNIVIVIAVASVIIWLICEVFKVIPPTGKVVTGWGNYGYKEVNSYFGICYDTQYFAISDFRIVKNSAFFAEAPMAALVFTFGMIIELFVSEKTKLYRIIILLIAVITTFSATGIIVCLASVIVKLLINVLIPKIKAVSSLNAKRLIITAMIFIVILAGVIFIYIFINKIDSKSGNIRIDDYRAGISAWIDSPIIGNGFMNDISIQNHMSEWRLNNTGFSNSITQILAHGGLYLGVLYIVPFVIGFVRNLRKRNLDRLIFILCTFALFCLAIFTYTYTLIFLLYFIAFGMSGDVEGGRYVNSSDAFSNRKDT